MTDLKNREPQMGDEVKNKHNEYTGTVIAKYKKNIQPTQMQQRLDVRISDDHVCYNTAAYYWEVTRAVEDIE
jgi:hypothetical protein